MGSKLGSKRGDYSREMSRDSESSFKQEEITPESVLRACHARYLSNSMFERRAFLEIDCSRYKAWIATGEFNAFRRTAMLGVLILDTFDAGRRREACIRGRRQNVALNTFGIRRIGTTCLRARCGGATRLCSG